MGWFWADSPSVVGQTPSGHPAVMAGKEPPVSVFHCVAWSQLESQ